jgi:hypothetical protein
MYYIVESKTFQPDIQKQCEKKNAARDTQYFLKGIVTGSQM